MNYTIVSEDVGHSIFMMVVSQKSDEYIAQSISVGRHPTSEAEVGCTDVVAGGARDTNC